MQPPPPSMSPPAGSDGYSGPPPRKTNVALIVSLSVVAAFVLFCVLAGSILLPVFAKARATARARASCMSNLKQIGVAMNLYAADHDEALPDSSAWMDAISQSGESMLKCPSVAGGGYGYAMNETLGRAKLPAKGEKHQLLVFESNDLSRNAHGRQAAGEIVHSRHGRNNVLYTDGSVTAERLRR